MKSDTDEDLPVIRAEDEAAVPADAPVVDQIKQQADESKRSGAELDFDL